MLASALEAASCRFHRDCGPHVRLDAKRQDAASTFLVLIGFTPTTRFLTCGFGWEIPHFFGSVPYSRKAIRERFRSVSGSHAPEGVPLFVHALLFFLNLLECPSRTYTFVFLLVWNKTRVINTKF